MNYRFCVIPCVLWLIASGASAQISFQQVAGPGGTGIYSFAKGKSGLLLAATSKHVFRSTDRGNSWVSQSQEINFDSRASMVFDTSLKTVYAVNNSQVSVSTDQGLSWNQVPSNPTGLNLKGIAVNASNTIFVGSSDKGVFRSTNGGSSWAAFSSGLPTDQSIGNLFQVTRLVIAPNGSIFVLMDGGGIARSNDNGTSWQPVGASVLPTFPHSLTVISDGTLFEVGGNGIFTSSNNGDSWTNIANTRGLMIAYANEIASDGTDLLISGNGLWQSRDAGNSWAKVRNGVKDADNALCISANGADYFEGLSKNGVFASRDTCKTWNPSSNGIISAAVWAVGVDSNGRVFATADTAALYRSDDRGDTWVSLETETLSSHNISSIVSLNGYEFYATAFGTGTFHTIDTGTTFNNICDGSTIAGVNKTYMRASCTKGNNTIFLGGYNGTIYRTTDDGNSWSTKRNGIPPGDADTIKFLLAAANGNIFAFTTLGIYYTTDNGENWQLSSSDVTDPLAVTAHGNGNIYASNANGIYYTTNNGAQWQLLSGSIKNVTAMVIATPSMIMAAASSSELDLSIDGGSHWTKTSYPFASAPTMMIFDAPRGMIYAGTAASGMYRSTSLAKSDVPLSAIVPARSAIEQNFPNPFSASTTIRYSIADYSDVRLDLFDLAGRYITTLVHEFKLPGEYSVQLDLSDKRLADGVYICRLHTNSEIVSRTIVHHTF